MLSKATKLALKANKVYIDNSEWYCYWHALSGDELKTQIFTVGHKLIDKIVSYPFYELSSAYKEHEEQGIENRLKKDFDAETKSLVPYVLEFLNDAKIEYTNKPFIKEIA